MLNLNKNQINESIAIKLGYFRSAEFPDLWIKKSYRSTCVYFPPRDYCSDIHAAWEIVEKAGRYFTITKALHRNWECEFGRTKKTGTGRTAAMAICRAFLKVS